MSWVAALHQAAVKAGLLRGGGHRHERVLVVEDHGLRVAVGRAPRQICGIVHKPWIDRAFRQADPIVHVVEARVLDDAVLFPSVREGFDYIAQGAG